MARKSKSVYDRINDKKDEILEQEEYLKQLNEELNILYNEKDELEASILLKQLKANGLTIDQALQLLNSQIK